MTAPAADFAIRLASAGDAAALAAFAEQTFRATFSAQNTAADMNRYCAEAFAAEVQQREIADPRGVTLLCERASQLIAYAQLVDSKVPDCVVADRAVELKRFYVAEAVHGTGLSAVLMATTLQHAAARGCDGVWLGVWEKNTRAIRFYRKMQFVVTGDHLFVLGSDVQRDLIMTRNLIG